MSWRLCDASTEAWPVWIRQVQHVVTGAACNGSAGGIKQTPGSMRVSNLQRRIHEYAGMESFPNYTPSGPLCIQRQRRPPTLTQRWDSPTLQHNFTRDKLTPTSASLPPPLATILRTTHKGVLLNCRNTMIQRTNQLTHKLHYFSTIYLQWSVLNSYAIRPHLRCFTQTCSENLNM